ncbi:MAG: SDR family NAD(P)-dependent oxidoreductase [Sphingobium sp.]
MRLKDKVAMVTGGGSGIGKASCIKLAEEGARVCVSDLRVDAAEVVAEEIRAAGGDAIALACDIGQEDGIAAAVGQVAGHYGRLDILHNNAALLTADSATGDTDILNIPTELWDQTMQVTLRGTMLGCRYAVKQMLKNGGGSIINTSSSYGVQPFVRMPAYGVAKAAINMLTQYVATSYSRQNIRCNAVAPSMIYTPALAKLIPQALIDLNKDSALTPFLGEPEDIANVVAFLASDEARYLTGQIVHADGGGTVPLATYADARRFFGDS